MGGEGTRIGGIAARRARAILMHCIKRARPLAPDEWLAAARYFDVADAPQPGLPVAAGAFIR